MSFAGAWVVPGGKVGVGETAETAAVRELREETGISVEKDDLEYLWELPSQSASGRSYLIRYFTVEVAPDCDALPAGGELAAVRWLDLADAGINDLSVPPATLETIRRFAQRLTGSEGHEP